jgi:hypothetical protein
MVVKGLETKRYLASTVASLGKGIWYREEDVEKLLAPPEGHDESCEVSMCWCESRAKNNKKKLQEKQ